MISNQENDTHLRFKKTLKGKYAKGHKSATHAARAELIHHQEKPGYTNDIYNIEYNYLFRLIETDEMEKTYQLTQEKIIEAAPLAASQQVDHMTIT